MFETFDHTADLGLHIEAPTLNELFEEAALALTSVIIENSDAVRAARQTEITLQESDPELLFFDWLSELLFAFESDGFLVEGAKVDVNGNSLSAVVHGESMSERHEPGHEVKAITYHGLRVAETESGWEAEVIVDI